MSDPDGEQVPSLTESPGANPRSLPELIKPSAAVDLLAPYYGGSKGAKDLLVDLMRDGKIRAYAFRTWTVESLTRQAAWRAGPTLDAAQKSQISAKLLRSVLHLHTDKERWDWLKGNFYVRRSGNRRTMFKSTRFAKPDITKLLPTKSNRGRKRDEHSRDDIWLAILEVFKNGGLTSFKNHSGGMKAVGLALQNRDDWVMADVDTKGDTISKMVTEVRRHFGLERGGEPEREGN